MLISNVYSHANALQPVFGIRCSFPQSLSSLFGARAIATPRIIYVGLSACGRRVISIIHLNQLFFAFSSVSSLWCGLDPRLASMFSQWFLDLVK